MSFADATLGGACFTADDIAQTPDKILRPNAVEAKMLMAANDAK